MELLYTIQSLLLTPTFMGNQSKLAKLLNVSRGTIRKYKDDINNDHHVVLKKDETYVLMAKL